MPKWLSLDQAGAHLGISRSTLYRMCNDGRLIARQLPGVRGKRFSVDDLEALLEPMKPRKPIEVDSRRRRRGSI